MTTIGEREAGKPKAAYAATLVEAEKISTRVMLHAIVNGQVMFFADCVSELSEISRDKVFTLLETGSRAALNALQTAEKMIELENSRPYAGFRPGGQVQGPLRKNSQPR